MLSEQLKIAIQNSYCLFLENCDTEAIMYSSSCPHCGLVVHSDGTDRGFIDELERTCMRSDEDELASEWIVYLARKRAIGYCFDVREVLDDAYLLKDEIGDLCTSLFGHTAECALDESGRIVEALESKLDEIRDAIYGVAGMND